MPKTLQERARVGAVALLVALAMGQNAASAAETKSVFLGRWTVNDPNDKYSVNGRYYRTFDIVACGTELCGISVYGGACEMTLFHFPIPAGNGGFGGVARWGEGRKFFVATVMGDIADNFLTLQVGDADAHLGSRNSIPTFTADYHKIGKAVCAAEAPAA